jgi:hypothetical protein
MPFPPVSALRKRLPALCLVALLHVAVISLLLRAIPTTNAPARGEAETKVSLLPLLRPAPAPKKQSRRPVAGTNAITPVFDPDTFRPSMLQQPGAQGLSVALSACAPENLSNLSTAMREQCARIDTVLFTGMDSLPNALHIEHERRWRVELLIKQTPLLVPCARPTPPSGQMREMGAVISIDLRTLTCIADMLANGYQPETVAHYSK